METHYPICAGMHRMSIKVIPLFIMWIWMLKLHQCIYHVWYTLWVGLELSITVQFCVMYTATDNQSRNIKPEQWRELLDIVYMFVQAGTESPKSEEVISPLYPRFTIHFTQRSLQLMLRLPRPHFEMLLYLSMACPNLLKMSWRDQWLHENLDHFVPSHSLHWPAMRLDRMYTWYATGKVV